MENKLCCGECGDQLTTEFEIDIGLCNDCIDFFEANKIADEIYESYNYNNRYMKLTGNGRVYY
jgi:hypothetical protein